MIQNLFLLQLIPLSKLLEIIVISCADIKINILLVESLLIRAAHRALDFNVVCNIHARR